MENSIELTFKNSEFITTYNDRGFVNHKLKIYDENPDNVITVCFEETVQQHTAAISFLGTVPYGTHVFMSMLIEAYMQLYHTRLLDESDMVTKMIEKAGMQDDDVINVLKQIEESHLKYDEFVDSESV